MSSSDEGLVVTDLTAGYGAMRVVHGVSFSVAPGELVAIVGRNGAGKTTSMLALAGMRFGSAGGEVWLNGDDLSRRSAAEIVRTGLSLVPEGHRIFRALTVRENLMVGASPLPRDERASAIPELLQSVFDLFPILHAYRDRDAGYLSGGEQQMVAIAQALMGRPRVLILDEPTSGLAPVVIEQIYDSLVTLRSRGLALLVVEQSVERALAKCDRYYVLERGVVAHAGTPDDAEAASHVAAIVRGFAEEEV